MREGVLAPAAAQAPAVLVPGERELVAAAGRQRVFEPAGVLVALTAEPAEATQVPLEPVHAERPPYSRMR